MKKRIAASLLAVSLLAAGPAQNVLAVEKVPARRAVINSQAAEVMDITASKRAKKPASRGNFGDIDVQKVIRIAVSLKGTPYKRGGEKPGGFDCSGFTRYAFKTGAGIELPHSSAEQAEYGSAVAKADLEPGNLVFFKTSGSGISHVGIFIGGDNFISASSSVGVTVSSLSDGYWGPRYLCARKLGN